MKLPTDYTRLNWKEKQNVRNQYVKDQDGLCYYCGSDLCQDPPESVLNKPVRTSLFPPNFFKYPVHLHHSHDTGMTLGAVHNYCNAVLWQYHKE